MKCFYFGCESARDTGHYLFAERGNRYRLHDELPFNYSRLDQLIKSEEQSAGVLFYLLGYTILAMADRSADFRPGSNSCFIVEGKHSFESVMKTAETKFPPQFARIQAKQPITLRWSYET